MNLINTFQRQGAALTARSLNRYRLEIPSCESVLDVEDFSGLETISGLYRYDITFTSPDKDLHAARFLRQSVTLTMGTGPLLSMTGLKRVHGVTTHFERVEASPDQAKYRLTLEPYLALLRNQFRTHRFFINKSVPEVVKAVLEEHALHGWEYEFKLKSSYPKRQQINQYQESDLAFIERLLAEVGMFYFFTLQPDTLTEVLQIGDDQRALRFGKKLPLVSPSGTHDNGVESVWDIQVHHQVVAASVTAGDYNHRDANKVLLTPPADRNAGEDELPTYGDVWHYRPKYLSSGDRLTPDPETGNFWARLEHERYLSMQTLVTGSSTDYALAPAEVVTISPASRVQTLPAALADDVLIVRARFTASRKDALLVGWEGVPYREVRCWRPPAKPRPVIGGTLMARVSSVTSSDSYAHLNEQGLYWVRFDADRDDKPQGYESMPVRLAKPYGGDTYGMHFPLLQGTEVAIAFHEGDPDRPYIAHALHDSHRPDHVTANNHTRNVIRTAGLNKLRMEDKRGEEHIKLSTEYAGKTQLNLGHNVDASRSLRGEGFELRSDAWGALRAGKGIFISAEKQPAAKGKVLEMRETLARLQQAGEGMASLSADAQTAKAEPAQVEAQLAFMREQIAQLKEAVAVLSAPQGIALSSGKHLQLAASGNLIFNAGTDADIGVIKRLFIGVGEGLSLFVRKLGIKLIANQGPVTLQAQNDQLQVLARNGLEIVSTEDEIHIIARKKITLNAGGSYITLDACKIEAGSDGDVVIKAADFSYTGPASMKADHPEYPPLQPQAQQSLRLSVPQAPNVPGSSWAGMPYRLFADGALLSQGVLDSSGEIEIAHQVVAKNYLLEMANGARYPIPVVAAYRNPEQGDLANRGLHHHVSQPGSDITPPLADTVHRNLYAGLMDGSGDKASEK